MIHFSKKQFLFSITCLIDDLGCSFGLGISQINADTNQMPCNLYLNNVIKIQCKRPESCKKPGAWIRLVVYQHDLHKDKGFNAILLVGVFGRI